MIFNLKEKDFGESRYIVLKEIDTVGQIGRLLINRNDALMQSIQEMTYNMEKAYLPECGGIAAFELPHIQCLYDIIGATEALPSLILQDLHANWDDFLSAWLCLITNYCKIIVEKIELDPAQERAKQCAENLSRLDRAIESIVRLFEFGLTYMDLINASRTLVEEIKTWGDARPMALKLSEAYLNTLNFYKE